MFSVEILEVFYGEAQALDKVSFQVAENEIVSVLGSNAAGKTTIMRTISGLLRPKSGSISFQDKPMLRLRPDQIVELGVVHIPEGREIFYQMSVLENLEMGAHVSRARKDWRTQLEAVYELFPILKARAKQTAGTLSGGEQQMLAIGRGLMAKPKLLMLDEPSLGLAPLVVKDIFEIIKTINKQGITILLVEQNIFNALEISNRAYILENGAILTSGSGSELLKDDQIKKAYLGM